MMCVFRVLLVLLALPALVWGQAQVINGNRVHAGWINYGTTAGTGTAYTLTFTPALPGYVTGQCFLVKPHVTNTGTATLNVQGLGAKSLTKLSAGSLVPLAAGDLPLNRLMEVCYDGTNMQLMGTAPDAASGAGVTDGDKGDVTVSAGGTVWTIDDSAVTYAKLPPASAASRLLGRSSTGAGPWHEITLGANLAMSGTTLNASGASGVPDADKGDITVSGTGTVWTIDNTVVTYAKLQNVSATSRLLGRATAGAGPIEELTPTSVKAMLGVTFGDISGTATAAQLPNAGADSTTKGVAAFAANDFNCTAGLCSLDYVNGPEKLTNKSPATALGTSDLLYPTQNAVKVYVDAGLATKQATLGFTPENSALKNASAALGTSNTDYPTQGAVKLYVDSGVKAVTNTALTPRPCTAGPGSPITLNADNLTGCDFVQIADLSGTTAFDIAGTPVNGQFISLSVYTAVARAVTWASGAGKFSAENGMALPTTTTAASYVLWGFRYNSLSNRWAFVATTPGTAGSGGSSDGTIHAADYGVVCDGSTNTTAAMQTALTAAKLGTQGLTLAMPPTTGACMIHGTLLVENVIGFRLLGNSVLFRWAGPPGIPMFAFRDSRNAEVGSFQVQASVAAPLATVFQMENGPGVTVTSTENYFHDIVIECTNGGCVNGVRMAVGAGGDNNNDMHIFERLSINNVSGACGRIDHSQSKTNRFRVLECMNNRVGANVIYVVAGSFSCDQCIGGGSTDADFRIDNGWDYIVIEGGNFENSTRLLATGGASGVAVPVTIRNTRWTGGAFLHADNRAILYQFRGPFILENVLLNFETANSPLEIYFNPLDNYGHFMARGNHIASTRSNPFTGIQPSIAEANVIDRNDGQGATLLDMQMRLGPTTFAQLGTAPWSTASNGNLTYCTDCTNAAICTGGGLGKLAVRENGAWTCGGGGSGGVGFVHLPVGAARLPATNPAVIDGSENNVRLRFDDTTPECAWWQLRLPPDYAGSPVFKLQYSMFSDTNTAHNVAFDVSLMAVAPGAAVDANTDSYATANACDDAAIPGTGGGMKELSCALTQTDGATAGNALRLKACRIPTRDNATGDAEGLNAMLEYARTGGAGGGAAAPAGAPSQGQYHAGATTGGSSGLTLDATRVLTQTDAVTAVSADTTLGAHNVVLVTTGPGAVMLTLPPASAPTAGRYVVVKADATLGELRVMPAGTDLLNTRNGFLGTGVQGTGWRLTWLSASAGWLAEPLNIPLRAEDLHNGTTGTGFAVLQTSPLLLGGHVLEMALTLNGHVEYRGSITPTVATGAADCGTGPSVSGNDVLGKVTVGTTPASKCTVTFAQAWSQAPHCWCQNVSAAQLCRGLNATTTTVELSGTLAAGNVVQFGCAANY